MTHVILRKIGISPRPDVPAAPPGLEDQPADSPHHSLPLDYEMEGDLLEPLQIGRTIRLRRYRRNHVKIDGNFESTPIVAIREPFVETRNSIYLVKINL